MSPAAVDLVPPDLDEAEQRLAQARRHHDSGRLEDVDGESSYILLYSAAHKAASAVLLAAGRRITGGENAHALLLREARRLLPPERSTLLDRLDQARRQRNRVAYAAEEVSRAQLRSLLAATGELIEAAQQFVDERRGGS